MKYFEHLPVKVKNLVNYLSRIDQDVYLIGGFVRDCILGKTSYDLDFVLIDLDPNEFCQDLSLKFPGKAILLDKVTKTTRFILEDDSTKPYTFDFTGVSREKLDEDFKRRDFTINALAIALKNPGIVIDKFCGIDDLKNKKIRIIDEKNLHDDPLRILRAFRFAACLDASIDKETLTALHTNLGEFHDIASERISQELWKMFESDTSYAHFKAMGDAGLLEIIFPELTECRKVPENDFHHLNLFDHSVYLIDTFEKHFSKIPGWASEYLNSPHGEIYSPKKKSVAKLGALLHDIGKPKTWEIKNVKGNEKHTFIGHDKVGAEMSDLICERLKLSNLITKTISKLIKQHLRPFQLSHGGYTQISNRALFKFFRELDVDTPLLLMLALADHYATCGPKISSEDILDGERLLLFLFDEYKKYQDVTLEQSKKKILLDGNEIMNITGLKPSRNLGILIKSLDEEVFLGNIITKEDAVKWVKNQIKN